MMSSSILVFGYYGYKNTGDDAMLWGLLKGFDYYCLVEKEVRIVSSSPLVVPSQLKFKTKFIRPKLWLIINELLRAKIIVWGGGSIFFDMESSRRWLLMLTKLYLLSLFAKTFRKKLFFIGVGIGPLKTRLGFFLVKKTLQNAHLIVVRALAAKKEANLIRVGYKTLQMFDLSGFLASEKKNSGENEPKKNQVLGLSLLPFYQIYDFAPAKHKLFLEKIIAALNFVLANNPKLKLLLFVFKGSSKDDDMDFTCEIAALLPKDKVEIVGYSADPQKTFKAVSMCDYFLAMRFHSLVFSFLSKIPLLVLDYQIKNSRFVLDMGLNSKGILSLDNIIFNDKLISALVELLTFPHLFLPVYDYEKLLSETRDVFAVLKRSMS